jgi:hypothetical protein
MYSIGLGEEKRRGEDIQEVGRGLYQLENDRQGVWGASVEGGIASLRQSRDGSCLDELTGAAITCCKLFCVPAREAAGKLGAAAHAELAIDPTEMELDGFNA